VTPVASVDVTPSTVTLASGTTQQFTATPRDAGGNALTGRTVTWSTSDPTIATVDGTGLVEGVLVGTATITATAEGVDGTAGVTVTVGAAAALAFTVEPSTTEVGQVITPAVEVTVRDAAGNVVPTLADPVTVAIGSGPVGATLGGTPDQDVFGGVATFADLTLDVAGTGYTLAASAPGLTGATSTAFDVAAVPTNQVYWSNPAGGSWSLGSNWSTGVVPGPADTAFIQLAGTYTVTEVDAAVTVGRLVVGDQGSSGEQMTLALSVVTLTAEGGVWVTQGGVLDLTGGSVAGTAGLLNEGTVVLRDFNGSPSTIATALDGTGSLLVRGLGAVTGPITTQNSTYIEIASEAADSAVLTVTGDLVSFGDIALSNVDPAAAHPATLVVTSGALWMEEPGDLYVDAGTMGGARTIRAEFHNGYRVWVDHPLVIDQPSAAHRNTGTINIRGGDLTFLQSGTNPSFTNTFGIQFTGGGTLTITGGTFVHTNGLVGAGTLDVSAATFDNRGQLIPELGTLAVIGDLPMDVAASQLIGLRGTAPGTDYGQVAVTGAANLDGTLIVGFQGFVPAVGDAFTILTAASVSGSFPTLLLQGLPTGVWQVDYNATSVVLRVVSAVTPVASVDVTPSTVTLASGTTQQFTATPRDAGGNPLSGRVVTWASNNTAVATVDGTGLVEGVLVGTATITATAEGV
ncbi:MAG: Ig-like domain-containing protein, partial [Gemmatimonadota bacterium]|nr:Ig-like domain-containing protein [Gemmatimonadota bacterium]